MVCFVQQSSAQVRYKDMIFTNVDKTTVTYSSVYNLQMDVYEPHGDTIAHRPVIVLAHGGSFVQGTKTDDPTVVTLCNNFAKRGYVTASIDYRLGNLVSMGLDSSYAINEVLQAISDGKASIRYFRKDAYTTNTFRIDTNRIIVGGNSAGAVLFMHYIYIECLEQCPAPLRTIVSNNGGLEGNSGNDGYSSEVHALINCAGGLNVPEFITPHSKPSVNFQGDQDQTVPYTCGLAESGLVQVRLCGLGSIEPLYQQDHVNHVSVVFPGDGHVPWQGDNAKMTRVDTTAANFLDTLSTFPSSPLDCSSLNDAVASIAGERDINVYPNPSNGVLNISLPNIMSFSKIELLDATGKLVAEQQVNNIVTSFNNKAASGIYLVRIIAKDGSSVVRKISFQ